MEKLDYVDNLFLNVLTRDDVASYKQLFFDFFGPLCLFAQRYVDSVEVSEDIVQGVFYQLWKNRCSISITTSARNYMVTCVRNACVNWIRRCDLESAYKEYIKHSDCEDVDYPLYAVSELKECLDRALSKLPENVRQSFVMNRFEGKTYSEIAEECGISIKTVEAHISRTLKLLRLELKDFLPFFILFLGYK